LGAGAVGISGATTGLNQEPAASNISSLYAAPTASTTTSARDPSNLSSTLGSGMLGAAAGYPQDQPLALAKSLAAQQVAMYQQHPDVKAAMSARSLPTSSLHAMLLSERLQKDAAAMAASSSSAAAAITANPYAATVENLRNEALRFVFNAGLNSIAGASSGSGMGATSSARNVMISSNMATASSMAAASSLKVDLSRMSSILSASSSSQPPPVAAASLPVSRTNLASSTAANVSTTVAQPQQQQQQPQRSTASIVEEIVQLQMFRAKGILTEFEFQMAKKKLLGLP